MQDNSQKLIIRMNNAWSSVETSHKKLFIAHDAIEQAEEQYQQARDRYIDAYADFQIKQLEYRQATGQE